LGLAENRCFDAKRARRTMAAVSEPLEGLPSLPQVRGIARKPQLQSTLRLSRGKICFEGRSAMSTTLAHRGCQQAWGVSICCACSNRWRGQASVCPQQRSRWSVTMC
jgi:hypothetical protein